MKLKALKEDKTKIVNDIQIEKRFQLEKICAEVKSTQTDLLLHSDK